MKNAYVVSHQSVFFDNLSYFVDWIWRKLTIDFQQWLTHLSPSWLVNKIASVSRHMAKHGFKTQHNWQPCGRHHVVYLIGTPMTTQPHLKSHIMISRRHFLPKSGTLSMSQGRNYITSTSMIFSNTNMNYNWSNHWHHHNAR